MANVFIEPLPDRAPAAPRYALEYADGTSVTGRMYPTQQDAVEEARRLGHRPLVVRVRHTAGKGAPVQWRDAD